MRVVLVTPWNNAWVPLFKREIESRGHEFILSKEPYPGDVVMHGWASTQPVKGARNVMFLRRYELFETAPKVKWRGIDHLICCNEWIADRVRQKVSCPVSVVYNAADLDFWTYKERKPNKNIGMACHIHPKKNLPLALQIMALLPEHDLHIAGEIQDAWTMEYLDHMARVMRLKVHVYGGLSREDLNLWWEDKGFCLSTSISEGNPNNVIEAMAKGIKPVVHWWPGADSQFPVDVCFATAGHAVRVINQEYDSARYRWLVEKRFSLHNIKTAVDIALGVV
jgi:glycosyltransferase involved in cell wall biosynthesis